MSWLEITGIATAVPALDTDGVALRKGTIPGLHDRGFLQDELRNLVLFYRATVTGGETATMSFLQLWVYSEIGTADWYPIGPAYLSGSDVDRGKINNLVALGEILTDKINLTQVFNLPGGVSRVYLREGTSGGAGYARKAFLVRGWGMESP